MLFRSKHSIEHARDAAPADTTAAMENAARELLLARVFDAPRKLVFKAWTDPEHVAQWYGPEGFSVVFLEADRSAQTLMTFRQAEFESVAARDSHRGGWTSCMERFAAYLAQSV